MRDAFEDIPAGPMEWLPTGSFLITATHDKRSSGVIIENAILCCPILGSFWWPCHPGGTWNPSCVTTATLD